ncbi:hypothetical protein [Escherichia coli]|uniref:hypothetical protein n=1 Tax=Escherichia coli TaxID=562 RepID=UPI002FBE1780
MREILISESAWEEMTCLFAPSLAKFIPDLTKKDIAILRGLTHFVYWAGRYPDPGTGDEEKVEDIFRISEKYQISAKDLFILSAKITGYAETVANAEC